MADEKGIIDEIKDQENESNFDQSAYDRPTESAKTFTLPSWLTAQSPDIPISEYRQHPLNYDNTESTSRIIRGSEGIFGSLRSAWFDIILGVIQKLDKKGKGDV